MLGEFYSSYRIDCGALYLIDTYHLLWELFASFGFTGGKYSPDLYFSGNIHTISGTY